jgi:ribonuclease D
MQQLPVHHVRTRSEMDQAIEAIRRAEQVAFDTEFVSEGAYEPLLCLIQLATPEEIWIIDPLAVTELGDLWEAVTSEDREMVALAAREEIRFCIRYAGRPPQRLLDPQIGAGFLGYGYPLSHTNLVKKALNVAVAGGEAFTDWRQRPLAPRQLDYASDDVRHLLALRSLIVREAEQRGRTDWVYDECRRLVERVLEADQEERWRVSGNAGLSRRELAVLREVWRWRDRLARATNNPPRRMLRDDLLVEVARRKPATVADLLALRGLDRGSMRDQGAKIVAAVQTALALPDAELPRSQRRQDPVQLGVLSQFLSLAANGLAAEHEIDPALLATSAELQELVRWRLAGEKGDEPHLMQGWRGEILGKSLLEILDGKRQVRVKNLKSANPLVFEEIV